MTQLLHPSSPRRRSASSVTIDRFRFAGVLSVLLLLFVFRVVAQAIQHFWPTSLLPEFAAWQSGLLPYPILLAAQLLLVGGFSLLTLRVAQGRMRAHPTVGFYLLSGGALYFAVMLFRLGIALTGAIDVGPFAGKALPAFFHLVLSSWLLVLGLYHFRGTSHDDQPRPNLMHWLAYPVLIAVCLLLHFSLLDLGYHLLISTYLPIAVGALVITVLERWQPHRDEWQPNHDEMANDVSFMVIVQIVLPKLLSFLVAVSILRLLQGHELLARGLWPHHWPVAVQAALMLLTADFLRYWLHRASHQWSPLLWRLHAVHHSPPKLYWVNVARFHPIEKAIQFLFDAAPFILVGVSENVLALYFVFYAVNGFFQHCNIEVRLGVLNVVISGPELHRWHHSREIRESNSNYGNNVIIWDLLFGSYFLPKGQSVGTLGLRNQSYPLGFLRQLKTPFIKGLDQEQP